MPGFDVTTSEKDGETSISIEERSDGIPTWDRDATLSVIGKSMPRIEGFDKVTGRAQYTSDVRLPRQAYARVLRSPHPHATIRAIDTSRAEAIPGVFAILTKDTIEKIDWYDGSTIFDNPVRLIGDEVAAVAAATEDIADDAIRAIAVTYDPLPFVTDLDAALADESTTARENSGKPGNHWGDPKTYERGDPEAGLRQAEVTVSRTYTTQAAVHNSLEPHGTTAVWHADELVLYASTQSVFEVRKTVAKSLGMPDNKVRVIKEHMGGGFGAKQVPWKNDVIAALLAREAGRPVQLMLDREAENLAVGNRPNSKQTVTIGALKDGTLTAIVAEIVQANGAYQTGGEASDVSGVYKTVYMCPNVRTRMSQLYTNTGPAVAFRAPGNVEGAWGLEQAMDELAETLGMDPIELRRKNYSEIDQPSGRPLSLPEGLRLCYDKVSEAANWSERDRSPQTGRVRKGIGFAAHDWGAGNGFFPGYAWIELNPDGTADVITGTQDIGTGTRTGLTQVASEALGIPMDDIVFHLGDTGTGPFAPISHGSATQATIGPAITAAAKEIRDQLLRVAAAAMEVSADRLSVQDGKIVVDGDPERSRSVRDVMQDIAPATIRAQGAREAYPKDVSTKTFGAQIAEVEVDTATGDVTVTRICASHECGRIVNPTMVESQLIGGITQGVGFALTEERVVDHRLGLVLNPNLEDYKVPTIADIPEIVSNMVDVPDIKANKTGAKGIGEPPLVPTAPAIANAIFNAIGVRIPDAPLTRERILSALKSSQEASA